MCTTPTRDAQSTLEQIDTLARAGCDIVRVAVPDRATLSPLKTICSRSTLPVVADVHYDLRIALSALEQGISGLRYNPGNIGDQEQVAQLACLARRRRVPIRIGVNAASLDSRLLRLHGSATPHALVQSALEHVAVLESAGFRQIKLSLKASDVLTTVAAYRLCAERCDYPLHLGVTEAGTLVPGAVKSTLALGMLLAEGIGDTIRVSLSADPVEEVYVAREILRSLGLRSGGLEITSCPGCGRSAMDVHRVAHRVERRLRHLKESLHLAIMGCEVNGPGEARAADLGIAGAGGRFLLFARGVKQRFIDPEEAEEVLIQEALKFLAERR